MRPKLIQVIFLKSFFLSALSCCVGAQEFNTDQHANRLLVHLGDQNPAKVPQQLNQKVLQENAPPVAGAQDVSPLPREISEPAPITPAAQKQALEKKKKKAAALKKKAQTAHKNLFFDNDFSYLTDPDYSGYLLGDKWKERCLPNGGRFSLGGQFRTRYHAERNMRGLGLTGRDDQFTLLRTRLYGDFRLNKNIRIFGEFIDAESGGESFGPRPIEVNRADMQNLFVDARLWADSNRSLSVRVGRQEINLGAQRQVSSLDWANTRRNFEGIRVMVKDGDWKHDGFWFQPMRIDASGFDAPNQDQEFMGMYSTYKGVKNQTSDIYFLRFINGQGTQDFEFNTIGIRNQGLANDLLWDFEGAYQFGDNTDGSSHVAGMFTVGLGHQFKCHSWNPSLWVYYDWASGDSSTGAGNGFHHNFPLAHKYNGFMDLFGRRNIEDVNIRLTANPTKKLKLLAWYHYLFLETQTDTPYSVVMTPFNSGNLPGSADLGHEIDLIASYKLGPRQDILAGYSHFFQGDYYRTTAGIPFNGNAEFFYLQWTTNF